MIDTLDTRALMRRVFLQHRRTPVHGGVEVERHAEVIRRAQRAALIRQVRERRRQVAAAKPGFGAIKVVLAREFETERAHVGLAGLPQHQRMMIALLDGAQIEGVLALVADQKSEAIDIEGARALEIPHAELDMARAHDVERRIEYRLMDGHAVGLGAIGR